MYDSQRLIEDLLFRYRGAIIASTFISPMEQELYKTLCQRQLPMIRIIPEPLRNIYKPTVNELEPMLQKILLVLSCGITVPTQNEACDIANNLIAQIAIASHGEASYIK